MLKNFNLDKFIKTSVTGREGSLLQQDIKQYADALGEQINNKSVLVIGGAGTIGSSYIRALLRYCPRRLYVVDINENGLTELVRDLRSTIGLNIPDDFKTYPIDFGSAIFEQLFLNEGAFEIVANFAAHKHVRSEKDSYSIAAMIENNVIKAHHLLNLLSTTKSVEHFFCVSTDKAANPVNIMGASKKLMEEVILAYASKIPVTTARFANVAFSNGSLPFGFLERFAKQQAWSCPTDVKRFFVSPEEAGQLCLIASVLGKSGDIFYPKLDINDMKPFSDIACKLLETWGWQVETCASEEEARQKAAQLTDASMAYPVYFFHSDTSGEKPYEEFYTDNEVLDIHTFAKLGVIKNAHRRTSEELDTIIKEIKALFSHGYVEKTEIVNLLGQYLPNFDHIETGKNLDQKM